MNDMCAGCGEQGNILITQIGHVHTLRFRAQ